MVTLPKATEVGEKAAVEPSSSSQVPVSGEEGSQQQQASPADDSTASVASQRPTEQ